MIHQLQEKLIQKNSSYTDAETAWLISHIGHSSSEIRDGLIYTTIHKGIEEELFSKKQFVYLKEQTIYQDLILHNMKEDIPSSLARTFAALLNACIIHVDGNRASKYYQVLVKKDRSYFFSSAIEYLKREHDFTGYSNEYGWVHGFAHGADNLACTVCHPEFPREKNVRSTCCD